MYQSLRAAAATRQHHPTVTDGDGEERGPGIPAPSVDAVFRELVRADAQGGSGPGADVLDAVCGAVASSPAAAHDGRQPPATGIVHHMLRAVYLAGSVGRRLARRRGQLPTGESDPAAAAARRAQIGAALRLWAEAPGEGSTPPMHARPPPLDALLPPHDCLVAFAAHQRQQQLEQKRTASSSSSSSSCDDDDNNEEEEVRVGGRQRQRDGRAWEGEPDAPRKKRSRADAEPTVAPSHPQQQPHRAAAPLRPDTSGLSAGALRSRSTSRSPPPPALRSSSKNSFSFSVRVGDLSGNSGSNGARARSPLPPRSTASQGGSKLTPPPQQQQQPAPLPVVAEGATAPAIYGSSALDRLNADPSPTPHSANPHHQHEHRPTPALRQTTLNFCPPPAQDGAPLAGPYDGAADRSRKRYAPGGHNDTMYGSNSNSGNTTDPQQQQRRPYFGGAAAATAAAAPDRAAQQGFVTAGEQLLTDIKTGRTPGGGVRASSYLSYRSPALGLRRGGFQPPFQQQQQQQQSPPDNAEGDGGGSVSVNNVLKAITAPNSGKRGNGGGGGGRVPATGKAKDKDDDDDEHSPDQYPPSLLNADGSVPDILKPLDPKLVSQVAMEILEHGAGARQVGWEDIAGLEHAKSSVEEAIIWPLRRPDLFVGLRDPPRGLLLFGPPGTGKTMIARAIANRASCTFMNISASSLMSKWLGDGEKLVRCMFAVATVKQPSVIFIDEIDSLLSMRGEGEMDSVRRVKTEFLVQLDGVATDRGDRVLLIGATNRPDELDEAARRRMEKRLYIPLPDAGARRELVVRLLASVSAAPVAGDGGAGAAAENKAHALTEEDLAYVVNGTEGYSGADLKLLCREAAMGPLREVSMKELSTVHSADLRAIGRRDFRQALRRIRPSVGASEVARYVDWNEQYGSFADGEGDDNPPDDDDDDDDA